MFLSKAAKKVVGQGLLTETSEVLWLKFLLVSALVLPLNDAILRLFSVLRGVPRQHLGCDFCVRVGDCPGIDLTLEVAFVAGDILISYHVGRP